jgi:7-keto-8-aminopelargonate synthetase-like enzyme
MDYERILATAISGLKAEGRYRTFADREHQCGRFPRALWHDAGDSAEVTVWCSNDYLGMGQRPVVLEAMAKASPLHDDAEMDRLVASPRDLWGQLRPAHGAQQTA